MQFGTSISPLELERLRQDQWRFGQEQMMAPYQLGQSQLGLESAAFRLFQERQMAPYQLEQAKLGAETGRLGLETGKLNLAEQRALSPLRLQQAKLGVEQQQFGLESGRFRFGQEQAMAPYQLRSTAASAGMGELGLQRGQYEFGEFKQGAGLRAAERGLGEAQARIGLAALGDVGQAGQRAYTLGREREELERIRMAAEARRLQSQISSLPQFEALRAGIMGRMAGQLGLALPQAGKSYSSGTGYTPSWMQSYQTPSFPRY